MKKEHIQLSERERESLENLVRKGRETARVYKRALGLLELDRGKTLSEVAKSLGVSIGTVGSWRDKYKAQGVRCLNEAPRPGRPVEIDGDQRAKITALACSKPPEGHSEWSLRLLAEKIVELDYCEQISHTQVSTILKNQLQQKSGTNLLC
ncbi:helix-turn-helix domain-containing protein [Chloroflexi bacterium TSY]|nr:helix-turn-helix domain-containing protein [Chloroflexi bacterium TSY]